VSGWHGNWYGRKRPPRHAAGGRDVEDTAEGHDMSDSNPYVEARHEWNDRDLDLVRERRWWQAVAGAELVLVLMLAGGFVWLSLQHKTIPYIVEVDSLGAALAVKPVEHGAHASDERVIRYQLAAFVRGARQVCSVSRTVRGRCGGRRSSAGSTGSSSASRTGRPPSPLTWSRRRPRRPCTSTRSGCT